MSDQDEYERALAAAERLLGQAYAGAARAFEMYQVAVEVFTEADGEQHSGS